MEKAKIGVSVGAWAAMVYFGIVFLFPSVRLLRKALAALLFSYCIEISQLYQAGWINAIRGTTLGALVLVIVPYFFQNVHFQLYFL